MKSYTCLACYHQFDTASPCSCPLCDANVLRTDIFAITDNKPKQAAYKPYVEPSFHDDPCVTRDVFDPSTGQTEAVKFLSVRTNQRAFDEQSYDYQLTPTRSAFGSPVDEIQALVNEVSLPRHTLELRKASNTAWRKEVFNAVKHHRDFVPSMLSAFSDIAEKRSYLDALQAIGAANERLNNNGYRSTMSDDEIKDLAKAKAKAFALTIKAIPHVSPSECVQAAMKHIVVPFRINIVDGEPLQNRADEGKIFDSVMPFIKAMSLIGELGIEFRRDVVKQAVVDNELFSLVNRACDEIWLRRQLRRQFALTVECVARDLSLVHAKKQAYCSDFSVMRQRQRQADNRKALEATIAVDEDDIDNWFELYELANKSISNPRVRMAEMFVRLKGFEMLADEYGHAAVFTTATTPSRFHAMLANGTENPKWVAAGKPTAADAHQHLMRVFTRLRQVLDEKGIKIYGMRVVEPHHDGSPHHHAVLFMEKAHRSLVLKEYRRLCLRDSPDEAGAKFFRFKYEDIVSSKGSAVAYVAKYISKNLSGKHIRDDKDTSLSGIETAERVTGFSRVNGTRQFQFIGGPSVGVWREMRRLREELKEDDAMFSDLESGEHYLLEKIRLSADVGDWAAFCKAMGGVFVRRDDQTVRLQYTADMAIQNLVKSGEFSPTRYGDMKQGQVMGVLFQKCFISTRFKTWAIENKQQFLSGQNKVDQASVDMMDGIHDIFDAMMKQDEYEAMSEEQFQRHEQMLEEYDQIQALFLSSLPPDDGWYGGAAPRASHH